MAVLKQVALRRDKQVDIAKSPASGATLLTGGFNRRINGRRKHSKSRKGRHIINCRGFKKAMSYVQLLIHAIIRTYRSENTLPTDDCVKFLYRETVGIIKNKNGCLYRINSMSDHVHLLFSMSPTIALSDFMKAIKASSSKIIKTKEGFESFKGWGEGYAALSYSLGDKNTIVKYIMNQQEHHRKTTFREEYLSFIKNMGLEFDDRDWNR